MLGPQRDQPRPTVRSMLADSWLLSVEATKVGDTVNPMSHLLWTDRPAGDRPVMIVAFEGWNDAADAATSAVDYLSEQFHAREFAQIDPEEFYDFTATRPNVRSLGGLRRTIDWPKNSFSWATPPDAPGGVILMRGVEPQLKWRSFCRQILQVSAQLDCSMVMTLGSLLADVAHTRPTPVFGNAYDQAVIEQFNLEQAHYEGPTGIVGVLHTECVSAQIDSASLWAAVPAYVPSAPSPKAALALVRRVSEVTHLTLESEGLMTAADEYEQEITALVGEDETTIDYVRHLEQQHDLNAGSIQSADDLVEEVERFLREQ
ncbi:MAG: PAC2 family protein [Actinobacteria bacterium]|nr:PAC2 family protein [Actinomycetota bacterium]